MPKSTVSDTARDVLNTACDHPDRLAFPLLTCLPLPNGLWSDRFFRPAWSKKSWPRAVNPPGG